MASVLIAQPFATVSTGGRGELDEDPKVLVVLISVGYEMKESLSHNLFTDRLELRPPQTSDAVETAIGMTSEVATWLTWPCPMSVSEAETRIAMCQEQIEAGTAAHWVLRRRDTEQFIGWTSL